jgi:hypothetical protein
LDSRRLYQHKASGSKARAEGNTEETTMKTLLMTSALVMAMSAPGFSQTATDTTTTVDVQVNSPYLPGVDMGVRASDFTEADTSTMSTEAVAEADANWVDAGEISDVIISRKGDTEAVLVDFGGFLGIGEKTVAVDMRQLEMVPDSGSSDDYFIVFHGSKADLEAAPAFDPKMVFSTDAPASDAAVVPADSVTTAAPADPMAAPADTTMAPADTTMAPADGTAAAPADSTMAPADTTAAAPADGKVAAGTSVDFAVMTQEELIGKRVYGKADEDVGEISAVGLAADGKIESVIVDVGGFLGMGEKKVALTADKLMVMKDANGTDTYLHVNATEDELKAMAPASN